MIQKVKDLINNLSLSFTISSSICAFVVSQYLYLDLSWSHYVMLSLAVWVFYTYDHLSDSTAPNSNYVKRYRFHQQHEKWLKVFIGIALFVIVFLLFFTHWKTLVYGAGILLFCLFYFIGIKRLDFVKQKKEFFAATCISLGVVGVQILLALPEFQWRAIPIFCLFFICCLQNLHLFSFFDKKQDEALGFSTQVSRWDKNEFDQSMKSYFVMAFIMLVVLAQVGKEILPLLISFFLMEIVLMVLWYKWEEFYEEERYRFLGDIIFFFPLLHIFF